MRTFTLRFADFSVPDAFARDNFFRVVNSFREKIRRNMFLYISKRLIITIVVVVVINIIVVLFFF